eukprot:7366-Heterocapsa_arctica.AAC.1
MPLPGFPRRARENVSQGVPNQMISMSPDVSHPKRVLRTSGCKTLKCWPYRTSTHTTASPKA